MTELDRVKRLDGAIIENDVGYLYSIQPSEVPVRFYSAIQEVVEPKCGSYENALRLAKDLQIKRQSVGYEEYHIVDSAAEMFVNWSVDDLRNHAKQPIPTVGAS